MTEACTNNQREQDARIFDPTLRDSLVSIINQLDPASFVKLARTCRTMHDLCFSDKRIEVCYGVMRDSMYSLLLDEKPLKALTIEIVDVPSMPENIRIDLKERGILHYEDKSVSEEMLQKRLAMPFRFVIDIVYSEIHDELNAGQIQTLMDYLRRARRVHVNTVCINFGTSDWKMFAEFVQEFRVSKVFTAYYVRTPIPEDLLGFFTTNLDTFEYFNYVPDNVILATTTKSAQFYGATISVETFKILFQRFVTGEMNRLWICGREHFDGDDVFSDPFVMICSEVMKVAQVANVDFIIKDPGVLYWSPDSPRKFHLLRTDGSTDEVYIGANRVYFG